MRRGEKVMLFVIGTLDSLRERGMVSGGYNLSADGKRKFDNLKQSGFEPTPEEISACMAVLMSEGKMEAA